ncbi:MAG TPA: nucleotidyltransferase family protein [Chloroflexota bacterium]|nr:nucleotidyltransferase family protein [Chloroflexota bacterium]
MRRAEALRILAEHRAEIETFGVRSLSVFGSFARDQARPDSDVDILVEVTRSFGYFKFVELQEYLERILDRPVDLFTPDSLRDEIRRDVLKEATRAA